MKQIKDKLNISEKLLTEFPVLITEADTLWYIA